MKWEAKSVICFRSSYAVFLSSAWENVGTTVMCNRCDVMNILWHKTQMAQKSDRERWAGGVGGWDEIWNMNSWGGWGGGGMRFGIWILGGGGRVQPGKGRRLPVWNIPGDEWENRSTEGGKPPLVRCSKNPVMSVLISSHSCFIGGRGRGHHGYWYQHKECSVLLFMTSFKNCIWLLDPWLNSLKFTNQPASYSLLLILPFFVFPLCAHTCLVGDCFVLLHHLSGAVSLVKLGHQMHSHLWNLHWNLTSSSYQVSYWLCVTDCVVTVGVVWVCSSLFWLFWFFTL